MLQKPVQFLPICFPDDRLAITSSINRKGLHHIHIFDSIVNLQRCKSL